MKKVALTGSLYSGIDEVTSIFKQKGVPVFDADIISKFIINHNYEYGYKIRMELGNTIFKDGFIDPLKFNTTQKFNRLLDIIDDELFNSFDIFCDKNKKSPYILFKYNILFERNIENKFYDTITVYKPKINRIDAMKNDTDYSISEIHRMIDNNLDECEKNRNSGEVIHNYTLSNSIIDQINKIHKKYLFCV